jgi:hypothetical protein
MYAVHANSGPTVQCSAVPYLECPGMPIPPWLIQPDRNVWHLRPPLLPAAPRGPCLPAIQAAVMVLLLCNTPLLGHVMRGKIKVASGLSVAIVIGCAGR